MGKYKRIYFSIFMLFVFIFIVSMLKIVNTNEIVSFIIGTILVSSVYVFIFKIYLKYGVIDIIRRLKDLDKYFLILIYILTNLIIITILTKERFVRYWDYAGYWGVSIIISQEFFDNPIKTLAEAYNSINNKEYNDLIPCLIALPLKVLGYDFVIYALIIYNMFVVPTFINILAIAIKIITKFNTKIYFKSLVLFVMLIPAFYSPIILGYLDAFSLLTLSLIFLILSDNFFEVIDWRKCFYICLCISLTVLGRRYFAFAIVGIAVAVFGTFITQLYLFNDKKEILMNYLKNGLLIITTLSTMFFILFRGFLLKSSTGNIRFSYSAYQGGNVLSNYIELVKYHGILLIIISLIGILFYLKTKQRIGYLIFLISYFLSSTILFYQVQSMGNHHYYITVVPITLFGAIGLNYLISNNRKIIQIMLRCLIVLNLLYCIFRFNLDLKYLFSNQSLEPKIRTDMIEVQRLANDLQRLSDEGHFIYAVASSTIINDDIIRKINMPDQLVSVHNMYYSNHVDLRDGFPVSFLEADIVVVADPVQYHLKEDSQRVVGILAEEFIEQNVLYNNFRIINNYSLEQNVKVSVYLKEKDYSEDELKYLSSLFDKYYLSYPELFLDRIK